MFNLFEMLGASFFFVLGFMAILWMIYVLFSKNAGILDIGWALAFVGVVWIYFWLGFGELPKKGVIALLVTLWGLRLAWQLLQRYMNFPEDHRYREIRQNWGPENQNFKMLLLFIFQGVLIVILSIPFLIICSMALPGWRGVEVAGILVWLVGFLGESLADYQLYLFRLNPENIGKVYRGGLWHYSRHPNYFFELIVWIGYFLFALGTPNGWIALVAPVLMLGLLTKISGIPLTEEQSLKSKGEDYADYQRTTSPFIPWFPKK
jgi:steroid 5-alpha reductase family enzyme